MDNNASEAVALLRELVAIPSVSRSEDKAADRMEAFLKEKGCAPTRLYNNVYCIAPGYSEERPTLLLDAHIDTVKPVAAWTRDPFTPTLEGDRLYGLGTNDDGGALVSMLEAFLVLRNEPLSFNLIFSASAEEEVSGAHGVEAVLREMPHIDAAIVGEPTALRAAVAEKGLMVIDFTAHGRAGHAARGEGINAIYKAVDDIDRIRGLRFGRTSPLLGDPKVTVTIIGAGTQHNVIPDRCTFTADVRSNEHYGNHELYDLITSLCESEAHARSFRLNSSGLSHDHPLYRRAVETGRSTFGSPTLSNQALMSFPSLKIGPGDSARSHSADEYIALGEIEEAIPFYIDFIRGLALS
jgi:acetylornithine deacetylase